MGAPELVFLAGPNGAGKSTFYRNVLKGCGLYSVNPDEVASKLDISLRDSTQAVDVVRGELLRSRVSFVTETVFSDPCGAKLEFLKQAIRSGYDVRLIFIGLRDAGMSEARIATRVLRGGHDVPLERLPRRFAQSLQNLKAALLFVPNVTVYDNSSPRDPFRLVLAQVGGSVVRKVEPLPQWLDGIVD